MDKKPFNYILSVLITATLLQLLCSPSLPADHAVVFQYHHIDTDTPPSTTLSPRQFETHLDYLDHNGYHVISLDTIVTLLKAGKSLPDRCVAITIDDAYTSTYTEALPLLKEHQWPFTVFVSTEGVDKGYKGLINWDMMREMMEYGASFESHSHTHSHLIRKLPGENRAQWEKRVKKDISTSIQRLKDELGVKSNLLAYPYGEYSESLTKIVLSLGLTGVGQHSGPLWSGSDFGALPRFPMSGRYADLEQFAVKARTLPLPVILAEPSDPLLPTGISKPSMRIKLAPGDYREDQLTCFVSGQERARIRWINRDKKILEVTPQDTLPLGRSRFNITAPSNSGKRYFWYSHLWIRLPLPRQ
jgi:biofilm PGA synthesis lipoprotein PgaB